MSREFSNKPTGIFLCIGANSYILNLWKLGLICKMNFSFFHLLLFFFNAICKEKLPSFFGRFLKHVLMSSFAAPILDQTIPKTSPKQTPIFSCKGLFLLKS
jgi:hypothetical protein